MKIQIGILALLHLLRNEFSRKKHENAQVYNSTGSVKIGVRWSGKRKHHFKPTSVSNICA